MTSTRYQYEIFVKRPKVKMAKVCRKIASFLMWQSRINNSARKCYFIPSFSKKIMPITYLVTGDTGFLGRFLIEALQHEPRLRVIGVSRRPSQFPFHTTCDLTSETQLTRLLRKIHPNVIIHSAGVPGSSPWPDLETAYIETTLKLIRAVRAARLRVKIIIPSSVTVHGASFRGSNARRNRDHDVRFEE
jgi:nucleoside-diphosphate-sugar epimerase